MMNNLTKINHQLLDSNHKLKAKCGLMEKEIERLTEENKQLKSICQDHRDHANDFKADCIRLEKENLQYAIDNKELKCTNIKLNNEINMLKTTIARNESYIKRLTHTGVWENRCR